MAVISDTDRLIDIASFVGSQALSDVEAGGEVLRMIHGLVPFVAASINAFDPVLGKHSLIANSGYSATALDHFDSWFVSNDEIFRHMRTVDPTPLRWREMPFPYQELYSAQEIFLPAGYVEGLTICFYNLDNRYTGSLHLSVEDPHRPTDAQMQHLYRLQRLLSGFTDCLVLDAARAHALGGKCAIVAPDGRVETLPGIEAGEHLLTGTALVQAVLTAARRRGVPRLSRWHDSNGAWHRIEIIATERGLLVSQRREHLPFRLTERELHVINALLTGNGNPELAILLGISAKTVAKHIEHILEKLQCETRTGVAVKAMQLGLVDLNDPCFSALSSEPLPIIECAADGLPLRHPVPVEFHIHSRRS